MTDKPTISLTLYQHDGAEKDALFLSPDGNPWHAEWIPRSLISCGTWSPAKVNGHQCFQGLVKIEAWKAKEVGWVTEKDERQGEMFT